MTRRLFPTLCVATLFALLGGQKSVIQAADHREAPIVSGLSQGDIGDVFAFLEPNDASRLVLAMDVNGFAVPASRGSYTFSTEFLYQFKIDNDGDLKEDVVIQFYFNLLGAAQQVVVLGPSRPQFTGAVAKLLSNAPKLEGDTEKVIGDPSGVQAFAGLTDDPFVFDAGQFHRILGGSQDLFREADLPVLGSLRGRSVRSDDTSGVDAFGGFNASMMVVSLPKSLVQGSSKIINVWGTVSRPDNEIAFRNGKFTQFERMGQAAFSTVFVPPAQRDAFNRAVPEDDVANFSHLIPDTLTTTDTDGTGNTIAGRAGLLSALELDGLPNGAPLTLPADFGNTNKDLLRVALLPDVIRLDLTLSPSEAAIGAFGLSNGRTPQIDEIDVAMRLLRQLADVKFPDGSGVAGSGPLGSRKALDCSTLPSCPDRRVLVVLQGTDFIKPDSEIASVFSSGNDRVFPDPYEFPFFASAHPLPGASGTVGFPEQE